MNNYKLTYFYKVRHIAIRKDGMCDVLDKDTKPQVTFHNPKEAEEQIDGYIMNVSNEGRER